MATKSTQVNHARSRKDVNGTGRDASGDALRFSSLFDTMLEGVMLIGFDWTYLYLNEAAARHGLGTREELLGRSMLEAYPGVEGSEIFAHYRECMEKRTPQRFEASFTFADGTLNWYELSVEPVPEGILVLSIDSTERKQMQQKIEESETKFRTFFDHVPLQGVIWKLIRDPQGMIVDWEITDINPLGAASIGLQPEAAIGKRAVALFGSEVMATYLEVSREVAAVGKPRQFETHFDSNDRDYLASDFMVGSEHYANISMDITDLKKAQAEIESLARFPSENPTPVLRIDPEGVLLYANPASDVLLNDWDCAVGGRVPLFWQRQIAEVVERHASMQVDFACGEINYLANVVCVAGGNYVNLYLTDITDRQQMERELRERTADLEIINAINEAANRGETVQGIAKAFLNTTHASYHCRSAAIYLLSPDKQYLEMQTTTLSSEAARFIEKLIGRALPEISLPFDQDGYFAHFQSVADSVILNTPQELQTWFEQFINTSHLPFALRTPVKKLIPNIRKFLNIHSTMILPLVSAGNLIGMLDMSSDEFFNAGQLARMQKIVPQITSAILRKQAEQSLRASEEKYRGLMESLDSLVVIIDWDGRYRYVNNSAASVYGGKVDELVNKTLYELFPEPVASETLQLVRRVLQQNKAIVSEMTDRRNRHRWYRISLQPIHDEQGKPVSVLVNATDIHELKTAQQELQELNRTLEERVQERTLALRESEERMELAFRAAQDGIWDWNMETDAVFYSSRWKSMLGYGEAEIEPHASAWKRLLHPDDLARATQVVEEVLRGEREYVMEFRMQHKDGHYVDILSRGFPIRRESNGPIVRIVGTHFDLTERKQMEDVLRQSNRELERAMRVKDEFLANMSHELRTPLNAVIGLSESLLEQTAGPLNEKQGHYIRTIHESGDHLLLLINDVLDLAKIGADELKIEPSPVNIFKICRASLQLIKPQAEKKEQTVRFEMDGGLDTVLADERRLKQMLVNLLSNAVKFTPVHGDIGLEVRANHGLGHIRFTVWDTGIGIKEEDQSRLFKAFVQVNASLTRDNGGTGLGLALVAQMAKLHGGSVELESTPGKGSRFTLVLPWENDPSGGGFGGRDSVADPMTAPQPVAFPRTILLVEDSEASIMVLEDYLIYAGYKVETARNGREAISLAKQIHPDLILMDIQMPDMNGLEAANILRSQAEFKETPLIALTAFAMPGDRERFLAAGMDEYISKPVNLKNLVRTIQGLMGQS